MKELFQRYKTHIYILLAICAISIAYVPDVLEGKTVSQSDITQYKGAASEFDRYAKNGDRILWTNSQFSGMPTYQISGVAGENPLQHLRYPKKPKIWDMLFIMLVCGYILFISFKVKPWLALIGSVALTFVSGNMMVMEAGHNTQAYAIAYLPLILAGVQFLFRKRYLLGANILMIGMALQLVVNHFQITYYTGIIILFWMLFELFRHIKTKQLKHFAVVAGIAIAAVVVAIGANTLNLLLTKEYTAHTIRGQSELTISKAGSVNAEPASDGLERWYAFQWSNGWDDIRAMFIPNYAGGGSPTGLYYGDLPFTSGPQYMGIIILFLAVLGFVLIKDINRWWLLLPMVLAVMLSMGKNHFVGLNDFFFNHVPLYNKFRVPTMALTIVQVCLPILAILGLNKLFTTEKKRLAKALKYTGIGFGAFLLILTFFSGSFNDFRTSVVYDETGKAVDNDSKLIEQYKISPQQFEAQIIGPREEMMKKDAYRALFFFAVAFLVLWFYHKEKLKMNIALGILGVAILADLWGVDKRYLSSENFKPKVQVTNAVQPYEADRAIMQDQTYYRVLDLTVNPMSSSRASNFHHSIGGYNAAKIRRYQELFDWYISSSLQSGQIMNNPWLNMLNTKYIIYPNQEKGQQPLYARNDAALGAAWFVQNIQLVDNPDSAIRAMGTLDPRTTAVVEAKESAVILTQSLPVDSNATIALTSYHPEAMTYSIQSAEHGFVVFSEIYYEEGWNAYLDGGKVDYVQTDYVLRGMPVPAGEHTIEFKFEPATYKKGREISLASNGVIYLMLMASLGFGIRRELKTKDEV